MVCYCTYLWSVDTWFLVSTRLSIPQGISIGSANFVQLMAERPCTLQCAVPFPKKLSLPVGQSGPPSDTLFLGPT